MTPLFLRLRALENKYNGPIPPSEREAVLYATSAAIRAARQGARFYRRRTTDDIEASRRWRQAEAVGQFNRQTPAQQFSRRIALCQTMLLSARQYLSWRAHLDHLNSTRLNRLGAHREIE